MQINSAVFNDVVNSYLLKINNIELFPIESRLCPNQFIESIVNIEAWARDSIEERSLSKSCVILILESPHTTEYAVENIGPAMGTTGRLIKNRIINLIVEANININIENYGLILVNAIPYQCSLGQSTSLYRDDVFNAIWTQGGKEDFISTLKNVITSDKDIIINSCTKGNKKPELRALVQSAILSACYARKSQLFRSTHPSCWYRNDTRIVSA